MEYVLEFPLVTPPSPAQVCPTTQGSPCRRGLDLITREGGTLINVMRVQKLSYTLLKMAGRGGILDGLESTLYILLHPREKELMQEKRIHGGKSFPGPVDL